MRSAARPFLAVYWEGRTNRSIQYDWQRARVLYITGSYRRNNWLVTYQVRSQRRSALLGQYGLRNELRRSVNRSTVLYIKAYTLVQHDAECRHDGVQQYHYTESTAPVRDRTTLQGRFAAGRFFGGPPLRSQAACDVKCCSSIRNLACCR